MADESYDFCGWATKANVKCTDGLTIMHDAFAGNDGGRVPMVWNHKHDSPFNVLGHADLENRGDGVYAYCTFNDTEQGQNAKMLVQHGDVNALSIYANGLKKAGKNVRHGVIREVSLVLAGANPKALIQTVLAHSDDNDDFDDDEMILSLSPKGCELYLSHEDKNDDDDDDEEESKKKKSEKDDEENDDLAETPDVDDEEEDKDEEDSESDNEEDEEEKDDVKHSDEPEGKDDKAMATNKTKSADDRTVQDVVDSMTDEQKNVMYFLIGEARKIKDDDEDEDEGGNSDMKHNSFDQDQVYGEDYISQADMDEIFKNARRCGSLKDAFNDFAGENATLAHSIDTTGMDTATGTQTYGFNDASMLFPDFKSITATPEWISKNTDWVVKVLNGVHRTPFSRIKSVFADITEDEARAKGYIKGNQKVDEVFSTLKRVTGPQTIYKKQKLDKDDIDDITSFDVVAWIRGEMRIKLNEELARAILIGDGRSAVHPDKIKEDCIRPIAKDVPLFNTQVRVEAKINDPDDVVAKNVINATIKGRRFYKGSGSPTLYTTEEWLTNMLLIEDGIGHKLYKTEQELATALRVKEIVTIEQMEGYTIPVNNVDKPLIGIIVNLTDYNVGADKGGAISMFDDFDIDFNQYKYLIETRCSGALIKPFSALTLYLDRATGNSGNSNP